MHLHGETMLRCQCSMVIIALWPYGQFSLIGERQRGGGEDSSGMSGYKGQGAWGNAREGAREGNGSFWSKL